MSIFQILSQIEKHFLILPLQQGYYLPFCGCLPAIVNPWMHHLLSTSLWKPECSKWNVAITVCMLVNCPAFLAACTSTGLWNSFPPVPLPHVNNYREVLGGRINHQYSFLQRFNWSRFFICLNQIMISRSEVSLWDQACGNTDLKPFYAVCQRALNAVFRRLCNGM